MRSVAEFEAAVVRDATYFAASRRLGVGRYEHAEAPTLEALREELRGRPGDPWLIYAVAHPRHDRDLTPRSVHVENFQP